MNLNEAKDLLKQHGFKVIKEYAMQNNNTITKEMFMSVVKEFNLTTSTDDYFGIIYAYDSTGNDVFQYKIKNNAVVYIPHDENGDVYRLDDDDLEGEGEYYSEYCKTVKQFNDAVERYKNSL